VNLPLDLGRFIADLESGRLRFLEVPGPSDRLVEHSPGSATDLSSGLVVRHSDDIDPTEKV
jgi:hypothetical protein